MIKNSEIIQISKPDLNGNELKYTIDCIKSGWISSKGDYVKKFECKFSKYCKVKYGISVFNGTVALHLALSALDIKKGDEVIVPNLTFIATANAVRYCGATPVFVDADKKTWNIDVNIIEKHITTKTKAIIPVHLYGNPCNMSKIMKIAKKHNLFVIEDCAEALGAEYKGKKVGSFGHIACFSFYGNKIITTGEGGICITNNKKLAEKMDILKNHGMDKKKKYWHPIMGYNYRMTNIQAAIGLAQLENINNFLKKRDKIKKLYDKELKDLAGINFVSVQNNAKSVCWMYSVLIDNRNNIIDKLQQEKIESRPFFYPLNKMPPYKSSEKFPICEELSRKGINLPTHTNLKEKDVKKIAKKIKNIMVCE